MIRLSYDSAYDPYHAAFRILRIAMYADKPMPVQSIRIIDFYLNFPHLLEKFLTDVSYSLPRGGGSLIKKLKLSDYPKPYGDLPNDKTIFQQMEVIQLAAIQTMCVRGIISEDEFQKGMLSLQKDNIPQELSGVAQAKNIRDKDLMNFLVGFLSEVGLDGPRGLKARTHLLEHRYDLV